MPLKPEVEQPIAPESFEGIRYLNSGMFAEWDQTAFEQRTAEFFTHLQEQGPISVMDIDTSDNAAFAALDWLLTTGTIVMTTVTDCSFEWVVRVPQA